MDFLQSLAELALGTRLKRLSDHLYAEVNAIYHHSGIDLKSRAFIIVQLLHRQGPLSVTEIADKTGTSHPSISQMVPGMIKDGLLKRTADPEDDRRKLLTLTPEAEDIIERATPVWRALSEEMETYTDLETGNFVDAVTAFEQRVADRSLSERVIARLEQGDTQQDIRIVPFKPKYAPWLGQINLTWLLEHYPDAVEPSDWQAYADPEKVLIKPGGQIYFALNDTGVPVGCCAIAKRSDGLYELCKMGVLKEARGKGLGEALLQHAIDFVRQAGACEMVLETGTKMRAAQQLYEKFGFVKSDPPGGKFDYQRADIFMLLELTPPPGSVAK